MGVAKPTNFAGMYSDIGTAAKKMVTEPFEAGLAATKRSRDKEEQDLEMKTKKHKYERLLKKAEKADRDENEAKKFKEEGLDLLISEEYRDVTDLYTPTEFSNFYKKMKSLNKVDFKSALENFMGMSDAYSRHKGVPGVTKPPLDIATDDTLSGKYILNIPKWDKARRWEEVKGPIEKALTGQKFRDTTQAMQFVVGQEMNIDSDLEDDYLKPFLSKRYLSPRDASGKEQATARKKSEERKDKDPEQAAKDAEALSNARDKLFREIKINISKARKDAEDIDLAENIAAFMVLRKDENSGKDRGAIDDAAAKLVRETGGVAKFLDKHRNNLEPEGGTAAPPSNPANLILKK